MTALDIDRLRRDALPGTLPDILRPAACRPVLRATWQAGPDGRLSCRWDTNGDTGDPGMGRPPR